jgi:hypothetical protein
MNRRLNHHLLLALLALVVAFVVAPAASAAALTTVVDVGETAGSITPTTVSGSVGDTFQIRNTGSVPIFVSPGTGSVSIGGIVCASPYDCPLYGGEAKTITIVSLGTLTIENSYMTAIGTLTVSAPVAAPVVVAPPQTCDSSAWNFGVVDYAQSGFGDQILVTWTSPKVCSGSVTAFTLYQATAADGAETTVDPSLCSPALSGFDPATATGAWSCSLKVASISADQLWFRAVATTSGGLKATSRQVKWVRGAAPNADVVSFGTGNCGVGGGAVSTMMNSSLVCFIISLVIQTEFASNGNQALTDKQARELLNIGVAFSDTQSARQGRAAKAKWVSIGKKTIKIKKSGKLRVSLPISKRGRALLKKAPLKVRVTYTLKRGANERRIVKFVTLPRIAS